MSLDTPRDLFLHELADTMSAEHILLGVLSEAQQEARFPEAKQALKEHMAETKQHIKTLEKVFKTLGETPDETTCHAAEGLRQEHQALHEEKPSPEVLEMGMMGGAARQEHYEIAAYTGLVQMAKDLGERDVAAMLQETLDQEKAMATRVEKIAKELGKQAKESMKQTASAD
jgi:ferritin-like metal-binding protein YciE